MGYYSVYYIPYITTVYIIYLLHYYSVYYIHYIPPQVLETCVKNCGHRFHALVAVQDFIEGVLVRAILPKYNPPSVLTDRVLSLIQVGVFTLLVPLRFVCFFVCFLKGCF